MKVPHGTTHALPKHSCHVSFFWCQGTKYLGFWHSAGGGKRSTFSAFLKLRHQFIHLILESVTFVEHENICISASWSYWRWLNQRWKTCADFCNQESPTSFALALHPIQKCIVEPPCRPWCFHSYCGDWLERWWKQQYQQFSKLWHQNSVLSRPLCRGCRIAVVFLTWGLRMSEHAEDSPQKRWGHQHRRMRPWSHQMMMMLFPKITCYHYRWFLTFHVLNISVFHDFDLLHDSMAASKGLVASGWLKPWSKLCATMASHASTVESFIRSPGKCKTKRWLRDLNLPTPRSFLLSIEFLKSEKCFVHSKYAFISSMFIELISRSMWSKALDSLDSLRLPSGWIYITTEFIKVDGFI